MSPDRKRELEAVSKSLGPQITRMEEKDSPFSMLGIPYARIPFVDGKLLEPEIKTMTLFLVRDGEIANKIERMLGSDDRFMTEGEEISRN